VLVRKRKTKRRVIAMTTMDIDRFPPYLIGERVARHVENLQRGS